VEGVVVHSRFAFITRVSDSESSCTKSTSQSEQRINPARYSALHSGQNIGGMIYRMRFSLSVPDNAVNGQVPTAGPAMASSKNYKMLVYLDGNFKLIKVVRLPAASRPTAR
jgi:hypothetical protein